MPAKQSPPHLALKRPGVARLARDLDGYVHTARGFLPKANYEAVRLAHPELTLPRHDALPLLNELAEKDQFLK